MTQATNSNQAINENSGSNSPELADIFWEHINDYRKKYNLHPDHYQVVADIMQCRTAYLGGHVHQCSECHTEQILYNSCRDRHCPKCQTMAKAKWLQDREAELLPIPYWHCVFTLPHEINPVALCNKRIVYGILFQAVSKTLLKFGANPENGLGGLLGITAILHTWNQKLEDHLHLHAVIPAGVLSFDHNRFITCQYDFLFPVEALSKVFRGIFMELFDEAYHRGELKFPGKTKNSGTKSGFRKLKNCLWSKKWVVYAKKPFAGPAAVFGYIARYTHRVAISNHRILACNDGKVTFSYRNRKANRIETETLDAVEFIRRFLLHVIPKRFMRIRHYGLLANRNKRANIHQCRKLLGLNEQLPKQEKLCVADLMLKLTGKDIHLCPYCKKGTLEHKTVIPKFSGPGANVMLKKFRRKDSP